MVSTAFTSGVSSTVTVWPTSPIFSVPFTVAVRSAVTWIEGMLRV